MAIFMLLVYYYCPPRILSLPFPQNGKFYFPPAVISFTWRGKKICPTWQVFFIPYFSCVSLSVFLCPYFCTTEKNFYGTVSQQLTIVFQERNNDVFEMP